MEILLKTKVPDPPFTVTLKDWWIKVLTLCKSFHIEQVWSSLGVIKVKHTIIDMGLDITVWLSFRVTVIFGNRKYNLDIYVLLGQTATLISSTRTYVHLDKCPTQINDQPDIWLQEYVFLDNHPRANVGASASIRISSFYIFSEGYRRYLALCLTSLVS